jgi:hypothetical protein
MHLTDETKVLFNPAKLRIISHPYISTFFANQSLFLRRDKNNLISPNYGTYSRPGHFY